MAVGWTCRAEIAVDMVVDGHGVEMFRPSECGERGWSQTVAPLKTTMDEVGRFFEKVYLEGPYPI